MRRERSESAAALAAITALTVLGLALRLPSLGDSLFGDELSTYYVVAGRSLGGTLHLLHGNAIELNPPLYFVFAWLGEQLMGQSVQSLRLISLLAGTSAIPLTYVLGRLTVGAPASLFAAALVTLSPFLIYFSTEARTYALLMVLLLLSSIALLMALRTGGLPWWGAYALCSCAAMYTHYTSVLLLMGQFLWAFKTQPQARRALLAANGAAAVGLAPWLPWLVNTTHSPGRNVIEYLEPFGPHIVGLALGRWSMGHPFISLVAIPGRLEVAAIVLGIVLAVGVRATRLVNRAREWDGATPAPGTSVAVVLAASTPIGLALYSLAGQSVWDSRSLISSWPGLALTVATLVTSGTGRVSRRGVARRGSERASPAALAVLAAALVLIGYGVGAAKLLEPSHHRPDYLAAARFIGSAGAPGDPVVDLGALTPGPPNETEAALALAPGWPARIHPVLRLGQPPLAAVLRAPAYASVPMLRGEVVAREAVRMAVNGRLFFVLAGFSPVRVLQAQRLARTPDPQQTTLGRLAAFLRALPVRLQPVRVRSFSGLFPVTVYEYAARGSAESLG